MHYLHALFTGTWAIARAELAIVRRFPRILLAVVFVALVCVLIYQYTTGRTVRDLQSREALTAARD